MKFKKILLVYKRTAYNIYFEQKNSPLRKKINRFVNSEIGRFMKAHEAHHRTLKEIKKIFHQHKIPFREAFRGSAIDYSKFDLVITVGGDGTFLEAARRIKDQLIIGVNSAPQHSVGRFCVADPDNFADVFEKLFKGRYKVNLFHRLRLKIDGVKSPVDALNDVLVCHVNPAMLCRYYLNIGKLKEEQRSSGLWISTAVGSTGATRSAGGRALGQHEKKIQYMPRELYSGNNVKYRLRGGVLSEKQKVRVISLMQRGIVFVDGAHQHYPLHYSSSIEASHSPQPIRTLEV